MTSLTEAPFAFSRDVGTARLVQIDISSHANDIGGKVWNPAIVWTVKHAVFVSITDEDGVSGVGECWCFDSAPDALISFLRTEVCQEFLDKTLNQAQTFCAVLRRRATLTARHGILASALSGIDMALWDIAAKKQGAPLWETINPNGTGKSRLYAAGGLYGEGKSDADLTTEMRSMSDAGFDIVKMKIGGESVEQDINRVHAVLDALPASTHLIIDGVYSYTVDDALTVYKEFDPQRIEAFQSPIAAHDIDGMSRMTSAGVPVMAVEAEYRPEIHTLLIANHAVKYLQVSAVACGGISRVLELAEEMRPTDIRLSLEVSSTVFALSAAAHLAAAIVQIKHVEYHMIHQVFFELIDLQATEFRESHWRLPDKPGLGFCLPTDDEKLRMAHQLHSVKRCEKTGIGSRQHDSN